MAADSISVAKKLIKIIGSVLNATPQSGLCAAEDWEALVSLAKANGVFQYVYRYAKLSAEEEKPAPDVAAYMEKLNKLELRRGILQENTIRKLRKGLEEKGIDHLFFKGSVTRDRYPDAFLRSMGDIDLLYEEEQHKAFCEAMTDLGMTLKQVGRVHDVYTNGDGCMVEAHRRLVSPHSPYYAFSEALRRRTVTLDGYAHAYAMTLEDEFLFNFLHLVSHFKKSGVGIRFIVDIWVYRNEQLNWEYIQEQLRQLQLEKFYNAICRLAEQWFGGKKTEDPLVEEIEGYILSGGIFGNASNRKSAAIRNGRFRYAINACFPSYEDMRTMFPWLKSRWLLPFAWVRRIFESITKRRGNIRVLWEPIKANDTDSAAAMKRFLTDCGLE